MIPAPLAAGDIVLRPWREDEGHVYMSLRDEAVFRFTTESPTAGADECGEVIASARQDPRRAAFAICSTDGRPVGSVTAQRRSDHVEISYWLSAAARGRGWARLALQTVSRWAFETWAETEVWLEIDPANEASIRVAEAGGFRRRGLRLESACGGPALLYAMDHPAQSTG